MAIVSSDRIIPSYLNLVTPGFVGSTALTSGGRVGFVFQAPRTGTIDRVLWATGTATGSPTVDVRLETVAATGSPSGTLFGTNTNVVTGTLASSTQYESALTSGAAVTQGDFLSAVFAYASGTSIQIAVSGSISNASQINTPQLSTGAAYSVIAGRVPYGALRYSDGAYIPINPGGVAFGVGNQSGFYTTGEKGLRFRFPFTARITGFWTTFDPDSDHTINLYADSTTPGGTAILSRAIATNSFIQKNIAVSYFSFNTKATLAANTWYRLVGAASGGAGIRYGFLTLSNSAWMPAIATDWMLTESSGSTWVDTTTAVPQMGPIFDGFDDGAGGGGGYRPVNIRGGADQ